MPEVTKPADMKSLANEGQTLAIRLMDVDGSMLPDGVVNYPTRVQLAGAALYSCDQIVMNDLNGSAAQPRQYSYAEVIRLGFLLGGL